MERYAGVQLRGKLGLLARYPVKRTDNLFIGIIYLVFLVGVSLFVQHYAVNWINNDDIILVDYIQRFNEGNLGLSDLANAWDNQHPIGAQIAAVLVLTKLFGVNFKVIIFTSLIIIVTYVSLLAFTLSAETRKPALRVVLCLSLLAAAFHPTQMKHFLWAFEIGWFLVNLIIVANALAVEKLKDHAALFVTASSAFATFCSAQGAFAWFALMFQIIIDDGFRKRWIWVSVFGVVGIAALTQPMLHAFNSSEPPYRLQLHEFLDFNFVIYCLQLIATASGAWDHTLLLSYGTALLVLTVSLIAAVGWAHKPLTPMDRIGLTFISVSSLSIGSFALGRFVFGIDWAIGTFHAAPIFVPFYFGLITLAVSVLNDTEGRHAIKKAVASISLLLLAGGLVNSFRYGATAARLFAMDRGYAAWVTCNTDASLSLQAKAAGLPSFVDAFKAGLPVIKKMCPPRLNSLTGRLVAMPIYFRSIIASHSEFKPALEALWQGYATDIGLQLAFDINNEDTPKRLIEFAKENSKPGSAFYQDALSAYQSAFQAM
jgi:hypothetical protein